MMFKKPVLMLTLAGCAALAACSTPTQVTTRDGQTTVAPDKPEIDDDGFVTYKKDGQTVRTNKSEIKEIREVD